MDSHVFKAVGLFIRLSLSSRSEMCRLGTPGVPGDCRRIIVIYSPSFPQRPTNVITIFTHSHFPRIRINHSRVIAMEKYTCRSFRFLGNTIIFRRQTLHG